MALPNQATVVDAADSGIRAVTDDEVAFLWEHGWVRLERLISPDYAARLLELGKVHMGPGGDRHESRDGKDTGNIFWNDRHHIAEDEEAFHAIAYGAQTGANVQRLMRREVGVLLSTNMLAVKIGTEQDSTCQSKQATQFHQDAMEFPLDRNGYLAFWVALHDITADMGALRFVDGSHKLGLLGRDRATFFDAYPALRDLPITEPAELAAGDATVHLGYTVHGTDENTTASPRWAFTMGYLPEDAVYSGGFPWAYATLAWRAAAELEPGDPFTSLLPKIYG